MEYRIASVTAALQYDNVIVGHNFLMDITDAVMIKRWQARRKDVEEIGADVHTSSVIWDGSRVPKKEGPDLELTFSVAAGRTSF